MQLIDLGMLTPVPEQGCLIDRRIRAGTADMTLGPAMAVGEAIRAIEVGVEVADQAVADGARVLVTGEVGIGNTTASAALVSVFAEVDPAVSTGRGSGAGDRMLAHKIEVVRAAIERNGASTDDPIGALAGVGGLEHAGLVGFVLGAAANRVPVLVDGVIACSAALVAVALKPEVRGYLIAGHQGAEPGIAEALGHLGLEPLLALGMRLGEGSGAAAALPLVQAAAKVLREMATFASAGVTAEHL